MAAFCVFVMTTKLIIMLLEFPKNIRIGDSKEFIITQDTTFTLISGLGSERNGYVPNYEDPIAVKDIGMDNVYGYYYNAEFMDDSYPGWHGIESVTITTGDDGKVIDIREHMQAG